ncbi:MAG TPA: helicase associated domain-containing protein [Fibrobacteria bacterium]|nr:helicase associated domain-containing protein [Fibrobacteria bacterium]
MTEKLKKRELGNPKIPAEEKWLLAYGRLVKFKRLFGHWPRPTEKYPGRFGLGQWMYKNRCQYFKQTLPAHRLRKLEAIGCPLDPIRYLDQYWEYNLKMLSRFRERYPDRWPYVSEEYPKGNRLGRWLREQRIKHTRGTLKKQFQSRLRSIGFPLKPITRHHDLWRQRFLALKEYREKHPDRWPDTGVLGRWCTSQRSKRTTGHLNRHRTGLLNKMDFDWNTKETQWFRRCDQVADYMLRHGGGLPRASSPVESERILSSWLIFQRNRSRRGLLEPHRTRRLRRMGISLTTRRRSRKRSSH